MSRSAIIGHAGQDGTYLSEYLRFRGDSVIGVGRGELDLSDEGTVAEFLLREEPSEVYYLAACHHSSEERNNVGEIALFRQSFEIHVQGVVSFLEGMARHLPKCRFFYAASSHIFGHAEHSPQSENTPFLPENIYGISKAAGVETCRYYRRKHGLHASCGILYNHESELRNERFVSQKIVRGAIDVSRGKIKGIRLGDLNAVIDWGYAPDYVEAIALIVAQERADDYVVASGIARTVREFADVAFSQVGLDWEKHVTVDASLISKVSMPVLVGNAAKLRERTGWQPKTSFVEMVTKMIRSASDER
jgi:GDPmannose 4,6-dehydratase